MDKIITHALFVTLLCALLGACGGGGDDSQPIDVWSIPAGGPSKHATCTNETTALTSTNILVKASFTRTLSVELGSLGVRNFIQYSVGTAGQPETVSIDVQEGATPQKPLHSDVRVQFFVSVPAGSVLRVSAMAETRGESLSGSVITTTACDIDFSQ